MKYRDAHASLVVRDVIENDTGRYICEASNQFGQASTSSHLRVKGQCCVNFYWGRQKTVPGSKEN